MVGIGAAGGVRVCTAIPRSVRDVAPCMKNEIEDDRPPFTHRLLVDLVLIARIGSSPSYAVLAMPERTQAGCDERLLHPSVAPP